MTEPERADPSLTGLLERLPHRGPMLWLDEVRRVTDQQVETKAVIRRGHILERAGRVPPLAAIELFAQTAAALMAHRLGRGGGEGRVSGALLGTRGVDVFVDGFAVGDELIVVAEETWGAGALAQFDCVLWRGSDRVAEGTINVASGPLDD
jgi:predicted hotdog family 3-hydroxylacyl-ACP dehydratase